jgi:hypothetical protein
MSSFTAELSPGALGGGRMSTDACKLAKPLSRACFQHDRVLVHASITPSDPLESKRLCTIVLLLIDVGPGLDFGMAAKHCKIGAEPFITRNLTVEHPNVTGVASPIIAGLWRRPAASQNSATRIASISLTENISTLHPSTHSSSG